VELELEGLSNQAEVLEVRVADARDVPRCSELDAPTALGLDASRTADARIMGPTGCPKCKGKGFRGRMCILEIFKVDDQVRGMVNEGLSTPQLRKRARELGMRTLREDGVRKVLAGLTTADEVIESTMGDAD
jgi:type IV pilus assembly protein PilB